MIRHLAPEGHCRGPDLRSADPAQDPWQLLGPVAQRRRLGTWLGGKPVVPVVVRRPVLVQGAYLGAGDIAVLTPDTAARLIRVGAATLS